MQTNYLTTAWQREPEDGDPSISIRELIFPVVETNTQEGDEFLDDKIRIRDQPYEGKQ